VPSRSRTIPLKGDPYKGNGEDYGRWYRCQNCGHTCDIDRDAQGSGLGVSHEDYIENATGTKANNGDPLTSIAILGAESENHFVALELGVDGNPKGIRHDFQTVINNGCTFCGCRNWKGDNP
jgi:hypothetical protein